jgi:hypothetical protein
MSTVHQIETEEWEVVFQNDPNEPPYQWQRTRAGEVAMFTVHPMEREEWKVVFKNDPSKPPYHWKRMRAGDFIYSDYAVEQVRIYGEGPRHKVVFSNGYEETVYIYRNEITELARPMYETAVWHIKRILKRVSLSTANIIRGFR